MGARTEAFNDENVTFSPSACQPPELRNLDAFDSGFGMAVMQWNTFILVERLDRDRPGGVDPVLLTCAGGACATTRRKRLPSLRTRLFRKSGQ
jgi:hypothetical protein